MNSLLSLLKETLLSEGRAEDVLRKYENRGVTKETIDAFVQGQNDIDPAINNKYLEWMVQQYINNKNINDIINVVSTWHKNLAKLPPTGVEDFIAGVLINFSGGEFGSAGAVANSPKDINVYSYEQLKAVGNALEQKSSNKEVSKQARKIYEDEQWRIVVPLSWEASCKYGSGTKWCVASNKTDEHFRSYTKTGILFYLIDKAKAQKIDNPTYKVAVLMDKNNGSVTIWNAPDSNIGSDLKTYFTPEMINAMQSYRKKYNIDITKFLAKIFDTIQTIDFTIEGWQLITSNKHIALSNGNFTINLTINLKEKTLDIQLLYKSSIIGKLTKNLNTVLIMRLEDIIVDAPENQELLTSWVQSLVKFIKTNWDDILTEFNPLMVGLETHLIIEKQINKFSGNWKFKTENYPTDTNRKSVFMATRDIENYQYVLSLVLDWTKNNFILKAEEKRPNGTQEQYDDQVMSFNFENITPKKLAKDFLNWVNFVITLIMPEAEGIKPNSQYAKATLRSFVGNYTSPIYGDFIVESTGEELTLTSINMNTKNLIRDVNEMVYVINKLQLNKVE